MTLSMTRSVLETGRAIGGQSIREHNEIIGMDAALHFLNGTMLAQDNPLKIQTILDIHTKLLGEYFHLLRNSIPANKTLSFRGLT